MADRAARNVILAACVSFMSTSVLADQQANVAVPISERPALNAMQTMPTDYAISSQDTISVEVFGVPEMSQPAVQVDNTGMIPMPLIGRVKAAGLTTSQLSQRIAAALDPKYIKNPIVTVVVKDAASQKITVDGEVTQPGVYQILPHTTLTQAVALAKGPDQVADVHEVAIVRISPQGRTVTSYDLDDIHGGKAADPFVQANDEIVVQTSGSRKFFRDFGSAISFLGWLHP